MTRWKAAIAGFGQIAAGYADDPLQRTLFKYSTHAQVLTTHPAFDWCGVVDPSAEAREKARRIWSIENVAAIPSGLKGVESIEVLVLAMPPGVRIEVMGGFPSLRAVVVEKPLAESIDAARRFLSECERRNILVLVNIPRRYESYLRSLSEGLLNSSIGDPVAIFGTYGNGLRNNGTHLVDLIRMLLGSVRSATVVDEGLRFAEGPLPGDVNVPINLVLDSGRLCMLQPVRFEDFREVSLDIWGTRGRLQLVHETLTSILSVVKANRQLSGFKEIAHDTPQMETTSIGQALYALYDDLAQCLYGNAVPLCSGREAYTTMQIIEELMAKARTKGLS